MKRAAFALLALLPLVQYGQTIVSTEPQNKNVVLEQYTGVNCPYCPQGSTIANQIYNANPTRVVVVAVHQGSFSNPSAGQPDFRTPFGNALAGQTGLTGYPAGTVNRRVFPGLGMATGVTAMGRGNWTNAANQVLAQESYVNVGATAVINLTTREITVYVEAYYTEASPVSTNKMNVVLLQDKTYGPQSGGNAGNNYEHNNRLVHMISGQWGTDITETSKGTLYTNTYTYAIPDHYNQVPVALENLRIAAFVVESTQEIISGVQVTPTYSNMPEFEYQVAGHSIPSDVWSGVLTPAFKIRSLGESMTALDIEYSINGEDVHTHTWQGSAQYGQVVDIVLPEISFDLRPQNTLTINITNEDNSPNNNNLSANFSMAVATVTNNLIVSVKPDAYGSEITWNIKNEAGTTIANGGPYTNGNTSVQNHNVTLSGGNYSLNVLDSYGDGILSGGYVNLLAGATTVVGVPGNSFSSAASKKFRVVEPINLIFDPVNAAVDIDGDGPFMIVADKNLYTTTFLELAEETIAAALRLKEGSATGANIPFTATISERKIISITPNEQIEDDVVVYLGFVGKDEDNITVNQGITFTVKNPVGINGVNNETVSVYPNPANGYFQITGVENGNVTVYTTSGQLVTSQTISSNNQHILLPKGTNGVLMVKIQQNDKVLVKPLVVLE
jgi:hypothetical protein